MPVSAYFVSVTTRESYSSTDYTHTAGMLTVALQRSLADPHKIRSITHTSNLSGVRVEVEVAQLEPESLLCPIIARCAVQADCPERFGFDKTMFTNMVRAELPFNVAVSKRAVSIDAE